MKRKRGSKSGKKSSSKTDTAAASDASPESSSSPSTEENVPAESPPVSDSTPALPEPTPPPEPEKASVAAPPAAVNPAADIPAASSDGQASELSGSDKVANKVGSIKILSAGLSSSVQDNTQDRKADEVDEPPPSKQEAVLGNEESDNASEPRNSQELEVKQSTFERQHDEKELTAALEAIKKVMKVDAAEPFNTPVDPVALGIPVFLLEKNQVPVPTFPTDSSTFGFMRDARASGGHSRKAPTPSLAQELKKLDWWQKYILCLKTEIHKENYQDYRERRELHHQQKVILHHVSRASGPPPVQTAPIAYKDWNNTHVNWLELKKHLYGVAKLEPEGDADSQEEYVSGFDPDDGGEDDDKDGTESE